MESVDNILNRLQKVKTSSSGGWVARCPAHDDRHPSLSIAETSEGLILIRCFAGCSTEDVVSALGLSMKELFPSEGVGAFKLPRISKNQATLPGGGENAVSAHSKTAFEPQLPAIVSSGVGPMLNARRDRAYNGMLDLLPLSKQHFNQLIGRGLPQETIERNRYRTISTNDADIFMPELARRIGDLSHVPGFFKDGKGSWSALPASGLLVPVRNIEWQIVALQIRLDDPQRGSKYIWFSSSNRPSGCSTGSPAHIGVPDKLEEKRPWITEGPLKADVASLKLRACVFSVQGVTTWPKSGVMEIVDYYDPDRVHPVVIAFDEDVETKTRQSVQHQAHLLATELSALGFDVEFARWT